MCKMNQGGRVRDERRKKVFYFHLVAFSFNKYFLYFTLFQLNLKWLTQL